MELRIQDRDIQIMKFVFACRVVTYDQIVRRHFPKTSHRVARRRIRELADQGYFKLGMIELNGQPVRIVQPLPTIWPLIELKWNFEVDHPFFKSESLEHDVRMTELYMRLTSLQCYRSFFTENLLQSSSALALDPRFASTTALQSDGALTIEDPNGNLKIYAVELEIAKKAPRRYQDKFVAYYLAKGIDGVLYICAGYEIASLIARADQQVCAERDSLVHFTLEKSVFSNQDIMTFSNYEESKLVLK